MKKKSNAKMLTRAFALIQAAAVVGPAVLGNAMANDEQVLKSDPINIEGYTREEAPVTDRELEFINNELVKQKTEIKLNKEKTKGYSKLQRTTEKLAEETESYLEEKEASQKVIDEYNKKIDCLLNKDNRRSKECDKYVRNKRNDVQDEVSTGAAAVAKVETKAPAKEEEDFEDGSFKILPYTGLNSMQTDVGNIESGLNAGIRAEMNVGERLALGIGFGYMTLENRDYGLNYAGWQNYGFVRDMEYSRMAIEAYGKFYLLKNKRMRPYIGGGINYARSTMNYTQNNNNAYYNGYLYANEEVNANIIGANASIGTDFMFTKNIGVNLEFAYAKAISVSNNNRPNMYYNQGQDPLVRVSDAINNANALSIAAGLVISF